MAMSVLLVHHGAPYGDDDRVAAHDAAVCAEPLHLRRTDGVPCVPVAFQFHDPSSDLGCAEYRAVCGKKPLFKHDKLS